MDHEPNYVALNFLTLQVPGLDNMFIRVWPLREILNAWSLGCMYAKLLNKNNTDNNVTLIAVIDNSK